MTKRLKPPPNTRSFRGILQSARWNRLKSIRKLMKMGAEALRAVAANVEHRYAPEKSGKMFARSHLLLPVISGARSADCKPVLLELTHSPEAMVRQAALEALVRYDDAEVHEFLAAKMEAEIQDHREIGVLLAYIGKHRQQALQAAVVAALEKLTTTFTSENVAEALASCAAASISGEVAYHNFLRGADALARLGDPRWMPPILGFLDTQTRRPAMDVFPGVIWALEYYPKLAVIPVLARLKAHINPEARAKAAELLFLVGTKEVIAPLLGLWEDEAVKVRARVQEYLQQLLGDNILKEMGMNSLPVEKMIFQWEKLARKIPTQQVLRDGRPIRYAHLIEQLKYPDLRKQIWWQANAFFGTDFGYEDFVPIEEQWEIPVRAMAWWQENGSRFLDGRMYRGGREVLMD